MADIVAGSAMGGTGKTLIQQLLTEDMRPGEPISYALAKDLWVYHPLGQKMVDLPIDMAMRKGRKFTMDRIDAEPLIEAFEAERKAIGADGLVAQVGKVARCYGSGALYAGTLEERDDRRYRDGKRLAESDMSTPLDISRVFDAEMYFSVFDPLNTAGSLVLDQNPLSADFMKPDVLRVAGKAVSRDRRVILFNEDPIYLSYTTSSYGFNGRSVFQRGCYALATLLETMETDRFITRKAGVLIEKIAQTTSQVNKVFEDTSRVRREMVRSARTGNVISTGPQDDITSLNLTNIDGAAGYARSNSIDMCAASASMPAILLRENTFAQGFGEGTEDSKAVADYIEGVQKWLHPVHEYLDNIAMRRAWSPELFKTLQEKYPETYRGYSYPSALAEWMGDLRDENNPLLREPESERVNVDKTRHEAVLATVAALAPSLDPDNRTNLIEWAQNNINESDALLPFALDLDLDALNVWLNENPTSGQRGDYAGDGVGDYGQSLGMPGASDAG